MAYIIRRFYSYLFFSLILILIPEAALEYRHYKLGYTTPIFGVKTTGIEQGNSEKKLVRMDMRKTAINYGPTDSFPFKSKIIEKDNKNNTLIWIASASHAEGGRIPAKDVFPNLICNYLQQNRPCDVINGSGSGMLIKDNIELLNKYSAEYKPDLAVLYQMSMIISRQQQELIGFKKVDSGSNKKGIFDFTGISKFIQTLSLYVHLTDYIGGNIKLSGQLKDYLPPEMDQDFIEHIHLFIQASRKNNVQPVLSTFAASHDKTNLDKMPFSQRTLFVKYHLYLSPTGWINMVSHYNDLLKTISEKEKVPLIELGSEMNGESQFFIDFVHFNELGHLKVAQIIANKLSKIIVKEELQSDF